MTPSEIWQARARVERGLILQILYVSPAAQVDRMTIDACARMVNLPIDSDHLERNLHDLAQRGMIREHVATAMGLRMRSYELLPSGREIVMGVREDPSIALPADQM